MPTNNTGTDPAENTDKKDELFLFFIRFYIINIAFCGLILMGFNIFMWKNLPLYFLFVIFIFVFSMIKFESNPIYITIYVMTLATIFGGLLSGVIYKPMVVQVFFSLVSTTFVTLLIFLGIYLPDIQSKNYHLCILQSSLFNFIVIDSLYIYQHLDRTETLFLYAILTFILIHSVNYTCHLVKKYADGYPNFVEGMRLYPGILPKSVKNILRFKVIE
jgi:hypothetical protein